MITDKTIYAVLVPFAETVNRYCLVSAIDSRVRIRFLEMAVFVACVFIGATLGNFVR